MKVTNRIYNTFIELEEDEIDPLRNPPESGYTIAVLPPRDEDLPATLPGFVKSITEFQTKLLGLGNASPTAVLEFRRNRFGELSLQFTVPTKRLERKLRTQLSRELPGVGFKEGETGLPVAEDTTVGGGLVTTGRPDYFPLYTEFNSPPNNALVSALHRHAMQDSQVVIQFLFTPLVGQPVRNWWWKKWAYKRRNYLRKEKEKLWGSRSPTKREREQAKQVDEKAGTARFKTAIRFLIAGPGEYTPSRVKELAGAFNVHENPDTGQYLNAVTVKSIRRSQIHRFAEAVADREYRGWTRSFRTTSRELAALVSIPSLNQENLQNSQP